MHQNKRSRLWNRYFVLSCLVCLFTGFGMNMMNSTMAKYVYSIYGNATFSGVLNAVFAVLAILGRVISGNLSDRIGRRVVILWGCGIFAAAVLGFGVFPWAAALILFRGLQGLGYSAASTANYAAGGDVLPEDRLGEGIGYLGLGYSLAMAVGPALALALIVGDDYRWMFAVTTGLLVLAGVCGWCNQYEKHIPKKPAAETPQPAYRSLAGLFERSALPATLVQLLNCLAFAAVNSFVVIFADSRGIQGAAMFFTCMAAAMCGTRLFTGRLTDRYGVLAVGLPAIVSACIGFLLLIWTGSSLVFYLAGVLLGIASGTLNPLLQAEAVKASPADRRGAANGTYQLSNDIANGLGAVLWGVTIDLWGFRITFGGCVISVLLASVLMIRFFRKPT